MWLWVPAALASSMSTTFTGDAGGWSGGELADGVLRVTDGELRLEPGSMAEFTLTARLRLAAGDGLAVTVGGARLDVSYGAGGGLRLGEAVTPLPLDEQAWTADSAAVAPGAAPSVARFAGLSVLARELDGTIVIATSSDGLGYTDVGAVAAGGDPELVVDADTLLLYYGCGGALCRARSADAVVFVDEGVVLDAAAVGAEALGAPSVVRLAEGTWAAWFGDAGSGATVAATSADGWSWVAAGSCSADDSRLAGLDVVAFDGGVAATWAGADGVYVTPGAADGSLALAAADRLAVPAAFAAWSVGAPAAPELDLDGTSWSLWVEGAEGDVGRLSGAPSPGTWVGLTLTGDGATLTVSWGEGATLTTPLASASSVVLSADGTLELDEALLVWTEAGADTGGDTGADTAPADTGADTAPLPADSGDSGAPDTGAAPDSAAPSPSWGAAERAGEPGGWGCSTAASAASLPLLLPLLLGLLRRSETR